MSVREKGRRRFGSQPARPFSRPQPPAECPPKCRAFAAQPRRSPLRQTACWSKPDSNCRSHLLKDVELSIASVRMKLPRLYAYPGELCPRVAFIVTNLTRPSRAHRCSLEPTGEQSIKESQRRGMPPPSPSTASTC